MYGSSSFLAQIDKPRPDKATQEKGVVLRQSDKIRQVASNFENIPYFANYSYHLLQ